MHIFIKGIKAGWRGKARSKQLVSPAPSSKVFAYPQKLEEAPTASLSEDESSEGSSQEFTKQSSPKESLVSHFVAETTLLDKHKKKTKSVKFSTVQVREYRRILGDNPSTEGGFPLSIDWSFNHDSQEYDINDHQRIGDERGRRPSIEYDSLDVHERRLRLRTVGYTEQEIRLAERRRKVREAHEWAFGKNHGCPSPSVSNKFVERYVR